MYKLVKRTFDIVLSSCLLILTLPIFVAIFIIIKIRDGKVFFSQQRYGKNGKIFKIYKFRTMYENAEILKKSFTEAQKREYEECFKLKNDPRVTKTGRFLRNTRLDELPQLINVLKNDLSLVGPRPIVKEELDKYGKNKSKLLSAKPGITGYWQVFSNKNTTYAQRMEMELYYAKNQSIYLDIKIILKTIQLIVTLIVKEISHKNKC